MSSENEPPCTECLPTNRPQDLIRWYILPGLSAVAVIWWLASGQKLKPYSTFGPAAIGLYLAALPLLLKPRTRLLGIACTVMLFIAALVPAFVSPAQEVGDWPEYYLYETAFINHASPEQSSADQRDYLEVASREGMKGDLGFRATSPGGSVYPYHFWLSSVAVAPLGILFKAIGIPWLRAFAVFNALLVVAAFYAILYWSRLTDLGSRAFAAFWICSPVTWYIGWPSAEVFSASLVTFSIVLFTRKHPAWATLLAALAATQNPPILVYVGLLTLVGAAAYLKDQRPRSAALVILAALPAVLPNIFYLATFKTANLIIQRSEAGAEYISVQRLVSFYLDLNQGVAPYSPLLLVLWVAAVFLAVKRRCWFGLGLTGTCVAMTVLSATSANWNSGCVGIIRYAVWQIPLIAWTVAEVFRRSLTAQRWGLAALGFGQVAIALLVLMWPAYVPDFLHHGPLAKYILDTAPRLYRPEPDIFFDRTLHYEVSDSRVNPSAIPDLSVVYRNGNGVIRKVLIPEFLIAFSAQRLGMPVETVLARIYPAGRTGLYYLDFP